MVGYRLGHADRLAELLVGEAVVLAVAVEPEDEFGVGFAQALGGDEHLQPGTDLVGRILDAWRHIQLVGGDFRLGEFSCFVGFFHFYCSFFWGLKSVLKAIHAVKKRFLLLRLLDRLGHGSAG